MLSSIPTEKVTHGVPVTDPECCEKSPGTFIKMQKMLEVWIFLSENQSSFIKVCSKIT